MLRRDTLNAVGLLDEDLFLGSDDLELSWRLRTHDLKLAVALDTFVRHIGGVSFGSAPKEEVKAMLYDSTERLLAKVRSHAGWRPSDTVLWGLEITHR
jgi:GT2 family glycosyltransferase